MDLFMDVLIAWVSKLQFCPLVFTVGTAAGIYSFFTRSDGENAPPEPEEAICDEAMETGRVTELVQLQKDPETEAGEQWAFGSSRKTNKKSMEIITQLEEEIYESSEGTASHLA